MTPIETALCLLVVHGALGAFDTFYNHEWRERLPSRPEAATELALHSARSWAFAVMFTGLAWFEWHGLWGWLLLGLVALEYVVTLFDSVVEDRTRTLSAIERVNHMLLGLNTGLYTAFIAVEVLVRWQRLPTALMPVSYGWLSWLLSACAAVIVVWAVRDAAAWRRQQRALRGRPQAVRAA
jgi:hypothetical protein